MNIFNKIIKIRKKLFFNNIFKKTTIKKTNKNQIIKNKIIFIINKKKQKEEESKFKPPNIAIFTFSKKVKDLQHFSRILQEFLSTIGI